MKRNAFLILSIVLFSFSGSLFAKDVAVTGMEKRDSFYSVLQKEFGFSKIDCSAASRSGYSPYYAFKLLCIAKAANKPVTDLIQMVKNGDSWADMCSDFNIDYAALMDSMNKIVIDNNMVFPAATKDESKHDVSTGPRKRGGK